MLVSYLSVEPKPGKLHVAPDTLSRLSCDVVDRIINGYRPRPVLFLSVAIFLVVDTCIIPRQNIPMRCIQTIWMISVYSKAIASCLCRHCWFILLWNLPSEEKDRSLNPGRIFSISPALVTPPLKKRSHYRVISSLLMVFCICRIYQVTWANAIPLETSWQFL